MSNNKKKFDFSLLIKVIRLATPYKFTLYATAILAVVMAPVSSLRPYLINKIVDEHIFNHDINGLSLMVMILVGLLFIEALFEYAFVYATGWLGQVVIRDLRNKVLQHITNLRLQYFDTTPIGTSTTRTISDIETINTVFSEGIITIVADILTLVVVLFMMFYTSWKLTLVCLTVLPILLIASYVFKEKVKNAFEIVRTQVAKMNAYLQEQITGMAVVQVFNAEKQELEKFKAINRKQTQANLDSILAYAIFFPVVEIISAAALGLMVWYGAGSVIKGELTLGVLIAFPIYINMLFRPIRMLADKFNSLQMGLVAANRVFELIESDDQKQLSGKLPVTKLKGDVAFKDVSFAYADDNYVIRNLNFTISPSKTLAIVGSTGSGKTTITNLLSRFYEIQKGEILIDGVNIKEYDVEQLRKRIAVVLQDVFLFSGSVLENITLRNPSITKDAVVAAAKMIGAHDFIMQLPNDYNFEVMERGATLSMGQRQLISFVRALVFNSDILILDEATSSIDPESETTIQFAIEKLIEKRTSIIIAHRLT
ncbi:MAG: ABC transporter ATP-binding protein, partial [Saprospiraceae bacterium]|nr:ABC transporter ATP-binding protein [Saprospiraceae bacterium]